MSARGWAALLLLLATGCGDAVAPTLSEITMSALEVQRGRAFFASVGASDPDGDLNDALIRVKMKSANGDVKLETEVEAFDVLPGALTADLIVELTLFGAMPLGRYSLEMTVEDAAGHESEPAKTSVRCTQ